MLYCMVLFKSFISIYAKDPLPSHSTDEAWATLFKLMLSGNDMKKGTFLEEHSFKCKNESEDIYLQFMAANSFIYSAQYTKPTVQQKKNIRFSISLKINCHQFCHVY